MAEVRSSNLLEPITVFQEIFQFGEFCFEFGEYKKIDTDLPYFSYPIEDIEVKKWFIETIASLQTIGNNGETIVKMNKLRKDILYHQSLGGDPEFSSFFSGTVLKKSIEILEEKLFEIKKRIEILNSQKFDSTTINEPGNLPKKRKSIPAPVKLALWKKFFGDNMKGQCYVCGTEIEYTNFEASHNIPERDGGSVTVDNLRPCCKTCNRSMGTIPADDFKKKYFPDVDTN